MIKIQFQAPATQAWIDWCAEAASTAQQHLDDYAAGGAFSIKETLYKKCRDDIFAVFHNKCAYCEALIILDQTGDVEHYRPKGKVTDAHDNEIVGHPGYFWLAYDWRNLLPSCARCNRPAKGPDGRVVGKWNRFPVQGPYALRPSDVATEKPLLLNPIADDPTEHFTFDPETGILGAKTARGQACIDILGLNREGLPEARRNVYFNVLARAGDQNSAMRNGDTKATKLHLDYLITHKAGRAEYSMAGRAAIEAFRLILKAQDDALGL